MRIPAILAPLLIAATTTGQMTTTMTLDTPAGQLSTAGGVAQFLSSPQGTPIPPMSWTWRIGTAARKGSGATAVSSSQTIYAATNHDGNGGGMGLAGSTRGGATERSYLTPSTSKTGAPGPVAFLMKMRHTANRKGAIRLTWQTLFKYSATSKATIDIGNNGSVEWTGTDTAGVFKSYTIPAAFDKNGELALRITLDGSSQGAGQYLYSSLYSRLTIKYVDPQNSSCTVTSYGHGCQGTRAAGSVLSLGDEHVITLQVTGGFPNAFVVEAVGNQQLAVPLPGGCSLLSNALVLFIHKTDAKGEFLHLRKASKFLTATSYHQYLPIDLQKGQLVLRASNGLKIVCIGAR